MRNLKEITSGNELDKKIFMAEVKIFSAYKDNQRSVQIGTVERNTPNKTINQKFEEELQKAGYNLYYEQAPYTRGLKMGTEEDDRQYEDYYIYINLCNCK
jgi:hypothetical protein